MYPPSYHSLKSPESSSNVDPHCCVGGVQISLSLSDKDDRQLILDKALELGWKYPEGGGINTLDGEGETEESRGRGLMDSKSRWKFCIKVTELWVPMESVTLTMLEDPAPYMYCYLKYRFYDSGEYYRSHFPLLVHSLTYSQMWCCLCQRLSATARMAEDVIN